MHRREWALTQAELARLLGLKGKNHVSRLEIGKRKASLPVLFAIEIVFGIPPRDMFPQLFEHVEERTVRELYLLRESLEDDARPRSIRKREGAAAALARAASGDTTTYDDLY